jgi:hypothetical protein
MITSAENRRILQILNGIQSGEIIPRPEFQRELVWSNRDKIAFLDTVLRGYPFPEIYLAVGRVDLETAANAEMLVDGQQRVTTLHQYFTASPALRVAGSDVMPYEQLHVDVKREFLNYQVAVRNLGIITDEEIREVFQRINATSYSLKAMEIYHAKYRGPLKIAAQELAEDPFFERRRIFSAQEMRRMRDVVYTLTILISMLSTYFNRDDEIETYLARYNDEFPEDTEIRARFEITRDFIAATGFNSRSRAWKKTDLLVLFVELDRLLNKESRPLMPTEVGPRINEFYRKVERELTDPTGDNDLQAYIRSTVQATNDRSSRVNRGRVLRKAILGEI